jgi:hypothetical protein
MSTTIERALRAAAHVGLALGVCMLVMAALPFVGGGRQVAVPGDPSRAVRAVLAAGGSIVEVRGGVTLARSDRPGFAAALYRAGAPLVLEGRTPGGCVGGKAGA